MVAADRRTHHEIKVAAHRNDLSFYDCGAPQKTTANTLILWLRRFTAETTILRITFSLSLLLRRHVHASGG
jgi:hypothetical protein